jgi:hypothetical protein
MDSRLWGETQLNRTQRNILMKKRILFPLMAAMTALGLTCNLSAQTWQTVDDFVSGISAAAQAICKDPFGNIYVAGYGELSNANSPENWAAIIRKSGDGGATWTTVDVFDDGVGAAPGSTYWWEYYGIASDGAGVLYAVGDEYWGGTWFVRRSMDSGATWQTVDRAAGEARAVTSDAAGNVYVAGRNANSWIVRKSADGGVSWSTVDSFANSSALGIFSHPTAGLFVAGSGTVTTTGKGNKTTSQEYGFVRRSTNGGATWTTVDAMAGSRARNIKADASGSLYVVGDNGACSASGCGGQWILRKSVNGGASFASVNNFSCVTTSTKPARTECANGYATDFTFDRFGNSFVTGGFGAWGAWYTFAWGVRESAGGTGPWQTVDLLPNPSPYNSANQSVAWATLADFSGVYVAGWTHYGERWVVRKLPTP